MLTIAPRPATLTAVAAGAVGALVLGLAIGNEPVLSAQAAVVAVALWFLLPRLTLLTAALAGGFFYDDYFTEWFGFWNPGKLVGLAAVTSLGLSWFADRRPLVLPRQTAVLGCLAGSLLISYTFARDAGTAQQVMVRYVMFFALFFITVQAVRCRADIDRIIDVTIVAGAVAALIGLYNFFVNGYLRVSGPIGDPGDFGFVLGATVPLAIYRAATLRGAARTAMIGAAVAMVAAIIGTFARADVLGLVVAGAWVLATGRLRIRWAFIALGAVAVIGLAAYQVRPDLIDTSLDLKQRVAQQNVDNRWGLWGVAIDEWESSPLFGVGPGNYEVRFPEFRSPFIQRVETTHNAYLNVLAELGLVGLTLFVTFIAMSWVQLRRRVLVDRNEDWLRTALAAGFLLALIGAMFMTQQFYPPLWFLAALGVAAARVRDDDSVEA